MCEQQPMSMWMRIALIVFPLTVVAVASAKEWPARAMMLDEPWRTPVLSVAQSWDDLVGDVFQDRSQKAMVNPVTSDLAPVAPVAPVDVTADPHTSVAHSSPSETQTVPLAATEGRPLKILMLGDSLMGGVVAGMRPLVPRTVSISDHHRSSTGLTNRDYYNWPEQASVFAHQEPAGWIFIHLGGNDAQDMLVDGKWQRFGSPSWQDNYRLRAAQMINNIKAQAPHATIVWIGLPQMQSDKFNTKTQVIEALQRQVAMDNGIGYVDGKQVMGSTYQGQGLVGGVMRPLRLQDGIHYSRYGGTALAQSALDQAQFSAP